MDLSLPISSSSATVFCVITSERCSKNRSLYFCLKACESAAPPLCGQLRYADGRNRLGIVRYLFMFCCRDVADCS